MKSPAAAKHLKAAASANDAFQYKPSLPHEAGGGSPDQTGKTRLAGAFLIALDRIEPDPNQPRKRIDAQHLEELAASIKRLGVIQPITVRYVKETDAYRIIGGECRYTAAKQAGLSQIPCWVRTPKENDVLLEQIIENWQRSDLNPVDLAESLGILKEANNYSQAELCKVTGKSKGEVSKVLGILDLSAEVRRLAQTDDSGHITKRHLYALRNYPIEKQLPLVKRIQEKQITADAVEASADREAKRTHTGDRRKPNWQRRTFKTKTAQVTFIFRKPKVTGHDILAALRELRNQVTDEEES